MKKKKLIIITIIILSCIGIIISGYNIIKWIIDSNNTQKQFNSIDNSTNVVETTDNENTVIIEQNNIPISNPYWDYIKMNLINIDFNKLKKENKHTKGWIQVGGTNINYPFVQTNDNDYYLTHSFDKSYNSAGWIFMDYRNNPVDYNKNTILYGHGRKDKTVFGTLRNILKNGWLENTNNYIVKLSTETENTLWQVFSVYHIPTTIDYLQIEFTNDEFKDFGKMLIDRSAHNFNTTINEKDKILTLSTCYNKTDKVVLHAKLIKKEARN